MKILQLLQTNLAGVGVHSDLPLQPYPFNKKILMNFLILLLFLICNSVFAIDEAESFGEYTQSIYVITCVTIVILTFVIIILNVKKLFQLINNGEKLVNTSECNSRVD